MTVPTATVEGFGLATAPGTTTGVFVGGGTTIGLGATTGAGGTTIGAGALTGAAGTKIGVPALAVLRKAKRANVDVTVLIITFISCVC
jgi:hypothetical protein